MKLESSMAVFLALGAAAVSCGAEAPSRQFGKSCAHCHQPPDLEFSTDRAWLDQIKRTAWMSGAEEKARVAMIEFLKSGELKPPQAVTTAPTGAEENAGFITPNFAEGALLLKDAGGRHFRLEWPKEEKVSSKEKAADRHRALPKGSYTLTGYRLVQRDSKGVEWFISASAPNLRRLSVRSGKVLPIEIDEQVHLTCRVQAAKGALQIQVTVAGEHKSGLSIYRDGRRIELGYRLSDATGKELAAGNLDYGWGGGASASCKPAGGSTSGAKVALELGEPPFRIAGNTSVVLDR